MIEEASFIAVDCKAAEIKEKLHDINGQWIDDPMHNGYPFEHMSDLKTALRYRQDDDALIAACIKAKNGVEIAGLFTDGFLEAEKVHHANMVHNINTPLNAGPRKVSKDFKLVVMDKTIGYTVWMAGGDIEQADRLVHRTEFYRRILQYWPLKMPNNKAYQWDDLTPRINLDGNRQLTAGEYLLTKRAMKMKKFRLEA